MEVAVKEDVTSSIQTEEEDIEDVQEEEIGTWGITKEVIKEFQKNLSMIDANLSVDFRYKGNDWDAGSDDCLVILYEDTISMNLGLFNLFRPITGYREIGEIYPYRANLKFWNRMNNFSDRRRILKIRKFLIQKGLSVSLV